MSADFSDHDELPERPHGSAFICNGAHATDNSRGANLYHAAGDWGQVHAGHFYPVNGIQRNHGYTDSVLLERDNWCTEEESVGKSQISN